MTPITDHADYRDFLKEVLEKRIRRNPRYSLRAFAKDLGIAPQNLSPIFKKKKGLSVESAARVAQRLALSPEETLCFVDRVAFSQARSERSRKIAEARLLKYRPHPESAIIREDVFEMISAWYHYAILELTYVRGFKSEPKWIAQALGISAHEATQAIDRLVRLGLLTRSKNRLVKTQRHTTSTHEIPSEAVREYTRQILAKASDAQNTQALDERDITTMTIAADMSKLPQAKELIRNFRRDLTALLESGEPTEVCCLAIELFKLSRLDNVKRGKK